MLNQITKISSSVVNIFIQMYYNFSLFEKNSGKQIDKDTFVVSYYIKNVEYKMLVKRRKGPRHIFLILDENKQDMNDLIFPYLGPNENFHHIEYTPAFFVRNQLVFFTNKGEEIKFERDEVIRIDSLDK
jgi:hypothetical protein